MLYQVEIVKTVDVDLDALIDRYDWLWEEAGSAEEFVRLLIEEEGEDALETYSDDLFVRVFDYE